MYSLLYLYCFMKGSFKMKKLMGTRILKTGAAVTLALLLMQILSIQSSFAGVVALIGIKPTTKKSLHYGSTLLLGSIISIVIGILMGIYIGSGPFSFGIATIIAISTLVAFSLTEGLILAVVVMYHVLGAFPMTFNDLWTFSFNELIITFAGIASSVIVNIIAPQKFNQQLHQSIRSYYHVFQHYLIDIMNTINKPATSKMLNTNDYVLHRHKIRQLIENAQTGKENSFTAHERNQYDQYIDKLKLLQKLLTIMEDISIETKRISGTYIYSEQIAKTVDLLAKIQYCPEKTTLSSYKRIFVLMDHLKAYFHESPLPESRQEFVDRASLHHIFLYINDYIDILFLLRDPVE